ncbi:Endo-1 like protein [Argiope bruennichi]|uniref:Endo-1 like protein n=2 Tax=Argiope bruennichi TaxID=94029 RepID=A0A8T0F3X9_ARGBR|nr:Endo-1 like protein [Argiope bruennichi]
MWITKSVMMSASGIALVALITSVLKYAFCNSQYFPSSALRVHNDYEITTPGIDSDAKIIVTLQLPHLSDNTPNFDLGHGRKKRNYQDKRQFSPWGGKRSKPETTEGGTKALTQKRSIIPVSIRSFSSWGGKRNFNARGEKRSPLSRKSNILILSKFDRNPKRWHKKSKFFMPRDGKRSFNSWGGKRSFNSWGGKKSFNSWGGKRAFNSWGGKRSFNSWGGKRSFSSWGGKKSFNSWGGKRASNSLLEKEVLTPEEENVYNKWKRLHESIYRNLQKLQNLVTL